MTHKNTPTLRIRPCTLKEANEFVAKNHRHHKPTAGHKFSISLRDKDNNIVGVAICGRPVSRHLDNGQILKSIACVQMAHLMPVQCCMEPAQESQRTWGMTKL